MKKYTGFKSKRDLIKALKVPDIMRKVSPTLKLSSEALDTPLPKGFLSDLRDFLTRSGKYEGLSISPVEHFLCYPATGVMIEQPVPRAIGPNEPFFVSMGIGDIHFFGDSIDCYAHGCSTFDIGMGKSDFKCKGIFICRRVECDDFESCWNYKCGRFEAVCPQLDDFVNEVQTNLDHPFVQDLMKYFDTTSIKRLSVAVTGFILKSMFDQSVLQ
jgi:hypothetical protein